MDTYITAHLRPDTAIEVLTAPRTTQWIRFDDGGLDIFADDTQLARLRDVISRHLDGKGGA
jgi:hypothetical protein